jgi:N-methylhydantoinase A
VLAAQGAAFSDLTATRRRSVLMGYEAGNFVALRDMLEVAGAEVLAEPGLKGGAARYAFDMRYAGQSYELTIDVELDDVWSAGGRFHELHEQRFAHSDVDASVEVVNVRATAVVPGAGARNWGESVTGVIGGSSGDAPGRELVWFEGAQMEATVYQRSTLDAGDRFAGPALVHQLDTTTLVPPGWVADVDAAGNLILERQSLPGGEE